ncbi:type I methionyl aminopeptidase [Spirulina sp. CS-785/01]|uniref:type I methionyl aminopeptidase n=1 Tax=Spirulina sp. CS-785/01 TaxID=3021716 RepID=UPI00232CFA2E|nr:type I methionyl aminopeptidase [Spirulina sp. CS-785/01]MDB9314809.1 type I methionyl aminopeptidase [Spirulina sp. CS-785/01]
MKFLSHILTPKSQKATPSTRGLPPLRRSHRGVELKSEQEVETMRQSGKIVATVLKEIAERVQPGMTTLELDEYAEKRIRELGATPSFKGYYGFPGSICICLNNEVVHGIPSPKKVIREGDLLKVDTGAYQNGYHGDSCITIPVGRVSAEVEQLTQVAEAALYQGIAQVKAGNRLMDIAGAIEDCVKASGYAVVEEYTGHGVGRNLHEHPAVFHFRTHELTNHVLKPGMTLAIEPIVNQGSRFTRTLRDRWTVVTTDNKLSAQFEHTVLVTETGYEILTDRTKIS